MFARFVFKTGFALLLCAFAWHWCEWGIQTFSEMTAKTAKDVAISVPKTVEVCHHHPQGCPKSCMCPKMHMAMGHDAPSKAAGTLNEPTLVNCTEQGPQSTVQGFAVFIPEPTLSIQDFNSFVFKLTDGKTFLSSAVQKAPQKIPIV
jgi:hypothetical protein